MRKNKLYPTNNQPIKTKHNSLRRTLACVGFCLLLNLAALSLVSQKQFPRADLWEPVTAIRFDQFEVGYGWGFLWAHRETIQSLPEKPAQNLEISWFRLLYAKGWHRLYRNPKIGLSYAYLQTGNESILGNGHSLSGLIKVPIWNHPVHGIDYQVRFGYGYLSKIFHPQENYNNLASGSHHTIFLRFSLQYRLQIHPNGQLGTGLSFHHFSNASWARPNLGLNFLTWDLTLAYGKSPVKLSSNRQRSIQSDPYWEMSVINGCGIKEIDPAGGRKYFTNSTIINLERRINAKYQWGFGFDGFFDGSLLDLMRNRAIPTEGWTDYWRLGAHVSYGIFFGKVMFNLQLGHYLVENYNDDTSLFNRIALRFYFHPNWLAHFGLKAHFGRADFLELGLGYAIPFR